MAESSVSEVDAYDQILEKRAKAHAASGAPSATLGGGNRDELLTDEMVGLTIQDRDGMKK